MASAAEHVSLEAKSPYELRVGQGEHVDEIDVRFHLTDQVQALTAQNGVRVTAVKADGSDAGTPAGNASVSSTDQNTVLVRLTASDWETLKNASGALTSAAAAENTRRSFFTERSAARGISDCFRS